MVGYNRYSRGGGTALSRQAVRRQEKGFRGGGVMIPHNKQNHLKNGGINKTRYNDVKIRATSLAGYRGERLKRHPKPNNGESGIIKSSKIKRF